MYVIQDGVAVGCDCLAKDVLERLLAEGAPHYGSMAGAVYYGGVTASPFDRPLGVETLYDGAAALGLDGPRRMVETGRRATYKVVALHRSFGIDASRAVHDPVGSDLPADTRLIAR